MPTTRLWYRSETERRMPVGWYWLPRRLRALLVMMFLKIKRLKVSGDIFPRKQPKSEIKLSHKATAGIWVQHDRASRTPFRRNEQPVKKRRRKRQNQLQMRGNHSMLKTQIEKENKNMIKTTLTINHAMRPGRGYWRCQCTSRCKVASKLSPRSVPTVFAPGWCSPLVSKIKE